MELIKHYSFVQSRYRNPGNSDIVEYAINYLDMTRIMTGVKELNLKLHMKLKFSIISDTVILLKIILLQQISSFDAKMFLIYL